MHEAQVMAEVFILITSGSSTLQRLCRAGVTATSGCLEAGREERVGAEGVGVGIKVCYRLPFIYWPYFLALFFKHQSSLIHHCNYCSIQCTTKSDYPSSYHTVCFNYQLHLQRFGRGCAKMYSKSIKT